MPGIPWKRLQEPTDDREYIVFATYLPMRRVLKLPQFLWAVRKISKQLNRSEGVVGHSLLAKPFRSDYWTLSAWESDQAARAFVEAEPHRGAAEQIASYVTSGFTVTRWTTPGRTLPPKWEEALTHVAAARETT